MLPLGSNKFKDPQDFDAFLNDNGGLFNGFVKDMDTVCSLKVDNEVLNEAMDR